MSSALAPVQSLWIGPKLSPLERCSLQSFLQHGHPCHLFVYDTVEGIPHGTTVLDASEVLPRSSLFRDNRGTFASVANLFRYKLLLDRGGYWSDLDIICLRPFVFEAEHVFPHELEEDGTLGFGNCVMKSPPGSPCMLACVEACLARGAAEVRWGELGPALLGRTIRSLGLMDTMAAPSVFCPIPSWEWETLLRDDSEAQAAVERWIRPESHAVHCWHELWRLAGADKWRSWPAGSLFERLKRRFGVMR